MYPFYYRFKICRSQGDLLRQSVEIFYGLAFMMLQTIAVLFLPIHWAPLTLTLLLAQAMVTRGIKPPQIHFQKPQFSHLISRFQIWGVCGFSFGFFYNLIHLSDFSKGLPESALLSALGTGLQWGCLFLIPALIYSLLIPDRPDFKRSGLTLATLFLIGLVWTGLSYLMGYKGYLFSFWQGLSWFDHKFGFDHELYILLGLHIICVLPVLFHGLFHIRVHLNASGYIGRLGLVLVGVLLGSWEFHLLSQSAADYRLSRLNQVYAENLQEGLQKRKQILEFITARIPDNSMQTELLQELAGVLYWQGERRYSLELWEQVSRKPVVVSKSDQDKLLTEKPVSYSPKFDEDWYGFLTAIQGSYSDSIYSENEIRSRLLNISLSRGLDLPLIDKVTDAVASLRAMGLDAHLVEADLNLVYKLINAGQAPLLRFRNSYKAIVGYSSLRKVFIYYDYYFQGRRGDGKSAVTMNGDWQDNQRRYNFSLFSEIQAEDLLSLLQRSGDDQMILLKRSKYHNPKDYKQSIEIALGDIALTGDPERAQTHYYNAYQIKPDERSMRRLSRSMVMGAQPNPTISDSLFNTYRGRNDSLMVAGVVFPQSWYRDRFNNSDYWKTEILDSADQFTQYWMKAHPSDFEAIRTAGVIAYLKRDYSLAADLFGHLRKWGNLGEESILEKELLAYHKSGNLHKAEAMLNNYPALLQTPSGLAVYALVQHQNNHQTSGAILRKALFQNRNLPALYDAYASHLSETSATAELLPALVRWKQRIKETP
jgi:hypothetical protein